MGSLVRLGRRVLKANRDPLVVRLGLPELRVLKALWVRLARRVFRASKASKAFKVQLAQRAYKVFRATKA